jgi:hypothetical protein
LRAIDPDQDRFDSVLFTIIPQTVRTQAHEDGIQTLLPIAGVPLMIEYLSSRGNGWRYREDYYAAFDRIFGFRRDLRELILDPDRWNVFKARTEQLEKIRTYQGQPIHVCGVRINPKNGRITDWGGVRDDETRRLTRHNINRIGKLNAKPQVAGIMEPLRNIAEMYNGTQIEMVVVTVPFGPGHRIDESADPIQRYLNDLKSLDKRLKLQHWIAYQEPFFHDCSYFFDYRHLNHKGRVLFTKWLAGRWTLS